ncbi:hypothetical protein EV560_104488 [Bosea sp. BK604]|nr:hypothetical protein EV560_104488 [Bosea sp. BK604]
MIGMAHRISLGLLAIAVATPFQGALAQTSSLQGAWLEEGLSCGSVYTTARSAMAFKRPASAFIPAFIISGKRLSTPLATCRIVNVTTSGDRQIMSLHCTTSIASDSARAVLAPTSDGGLLRYLAAEGGIATKYQRCDRDNLKARDGGGTSGRSATPGRSPS